MEYQCTVEKIRSGVKTEEKNQEKTYLLELHANARSCQVVLNYFHSEVFETTDLVVCLLPNIIKQTFNKA